MHAEFTLLSDQPIPSGCAVSTVYGEGVVIGYRSSDSSFIVTLSFGATAYLNRNAILCTVLPVDTFEELEHTIETDEDPPSKFELVLSSVLGAHQTFGHCKETRILC